MALTRLQVMSPHRRSTTSTSRVVQRRAARTKGGRKFPIKEAIISPSSVGAFGAALFRSGLGARVATIARQQITRVPGLSRFARTTQAAREGPSPAQLSLIGPTRPATRSLVQRVVPPAAKAVAIGTAFQAGVEAVDRFGPFQIPRFGQGKIGPPRPPTQRGGPTLARHRQIQQVPFTPGTVVPTDSIVHTWVANGVPFAQLADGRVMVRKKNGTIKTFRRPKPIVLGRNPGIRDLVRADKKIDGLMKLIRKRLPAARRPKATSRDHSHSVTSH